MRLKMFSKKIFIFSFLILAVTAILWPILFNGQVINDFFGLDLAHYKFSKDFGDSIKDGNLKLWWPNYLSGFPVYLTQTGLFSPVIFILYKFFGGFAVYNWLTFFNFLLGGLAIYWFSRNLALSKIASLIAGLAYILSQNHLYWGPTLVFSNVYPFIPLFFLAILKISKNRNWWWFWGILIVCGDPSFQSSACVLYSFCCNLLVPITLI